MSSTDGHGDQESIRKGLPVPVQENRERIIRMETTLENVQDDVKELKTDVKDLTVKVGTLEAEIKKYGAYIVTAIFVFEAATRWILPLLGQAAS